MKRAILLMFLFIVSLCSRAASNESTPVGQPSVFWIDGQWQTWNNGAWTPYGQKPTAKSDNPDHERRGNGGNPNQPARMRRAQRTATGKSEGEHSATDLESAPTQGLPIGQPNVAIGQPNVAIGQTTIGIGQPTIGIGQPTIGIGQPTIGIGQSMTGIGQTTIGIGQPMAGFGQTTIGIGQPTIGIGQPTIGIGQPTIGIGQPTIGIGKPNVGIGKQSEHQKPQPPPPHIKKPEVTEKVKKPLL